MADLRYRRGYAAERTIYFVIHIGRIGDSMASNYVIYHHGIKGMKWGVIRTPEQLGHTVKEKPSAQFSKKKTNTDALSDDEITNRIRRLDLEERYAAALSRKKQRESTGFGGKVKNIVHGALEQSGKDLVYGIAGNLVRKMLKRMEGKSTDKNRLEKIHNMDIDKMDGETLATVSKLYANAVAISTSRKKLGIDTDDPS